MIDNLSENPVSSIFQLHHSRPPPHLISEIKQKPPPVFVGRFRSAAATSAMIDGIGENVAGSAKRPFLLCHSATELRDSASTLADKQFIQGGCLLKQSDARLFVAMLTKIFETRRNLGARREEI